MNISNELMTIKKSDNLEDTDEDNGSAYASWGLLGLNLGFIISCVFCV